MVKVILAGGTGLIGGAALQRLIDHPDVTSIVALSRRELPIKNAKVQTVIVKDFLKYDSEALAQLEGAKAAIW
jgi:N-acetyl-gamma-glutamylphosphate reductase